MEEGSPSALSPTTDASSSSNATQPAPFKVWRPPKSGQLGASTFRELPETYFEPTTGEIMALQQSRTSERERLTDGPLKTSIIREREERRREARYPTTRIRIKFPDQTQLERVFHSTDKIRSVYAFVRNSLKEDVKPIKFVLYQTPPRRELKVSDPNVRDKSLFQLQLAPSSVLMLSFLDESLNHHDRPAPLTEEILALSEDLPLPPTFDEPAGAPSEPKKRGGPAVQNAVEAKVPKWLKLTKK